MALSKGSIDIAWRLFDKMIKPTGLRINKIIREFDNSNYDKRKLGFVFGDRQTFDDSWECVFIQLKNVDLDTLQIWEAGKVDIPNSSFKTQLSDGIVRFGFY